MNEAQSGRSAILATQLKKLRTLLATVVPSNPFQSRKLAGCGPGLASLEEFSRSVPLTTKGELVADQLAHPPYGTNLTYPIERYTRCHQTSGTTGKPLRWLDDPESWSGLVDGWVEVYRAAGLTPQDRVLFAFSFGPFIGFWMAFEAAERLGALCVPGGGMSSVGRLRVILDQGITVLCCTPTYALHLGEVAAAEEIDLSASRVRLIVVAGEPGGSIPSARARIESFWSGARVFDHHGMTEVGPVTYECPAEPGVLHVVETAYYAEVVDSETAQPLDEGRPGELLLTTLGRLGMPLLRYRTGDLVKLRFPSRSSQTPPCRCGRFELALEGGILGRSDDMVIIRGVNLFPLGVEGLIREFREVAEYQVRLTTVAGMTEMAVTIEPVPGVGDPTRLARHIQEAFQTAFALRVPIAAVAPGTLPRFEMKARRWVRDCAKVD